MNKLEVNIEIRWADIDANRHVRHSAYYDFGAHARTNFFKEMNLDTNKMKELNIAPILFKEECSFIKELHPEDYIKVNVLKGQVKEDASRWALHHEIFNQKNEKCAHITIKGAWMHLEKRKLTVPPKDFAITFHELPLGENYVYKK